MCKRFLTNNMASPANSDITSLYIRPEQSQTSGATNERSNDLLTVSGTIQRADWTVTELDQIKANLFQNCQIFLNKERNTQYAGHKLLVVVSLTRFLMVQHFISMSHQAEV